MEVFHTFVPDQKKGVMVCQISNSAEFDVLLRVSGGINLEKKTVSIAALEISYRQPEIKKGCELIFSEQQCDCKVIHALLGKSGIHKDFLTEVVPNLCAKKHVLQKDSDFFNIVSFDFQKKSEDQRNVMISGGDFGRLFQSLIFNPDLCKSDILSESRVFNFLQEYVVPGTKFLFLSRGKVVDQSTVPEYSKQMKSIATKVRSSTRSIN
jgi:hypothetical protein